MSSEQNPVGIDLGTTYSAIAYLDGDGRPTTIPNSEGELTTPSVVFFDHDGVIVGTEGSFAGESEPERLAKLAKRDMGGSRYRKKIMNNDLPPEVIQSLVLQRLKSDAELKIGEFTKAVITVPAYFNEPRRKATQDAGAIAGLDVIDIINEPTAAALAYGVQQGFLTEKGESHKSEIVLVYDLGGGTFDVTLMQIKGAKFSALATAGDVYLGGVDFDQRIFDYAVQQIEEKNDVSVQNDARLAERLMQQCTRAKKALTARAETVIRVESDGARYKIDISRETFEELTQDLLERTRLTTDRLLREAGKNWKDLTKLLLVGGSTRMPMVQSMLERESGLKVDRSLSPDEAVAHGAAIYAGILMKHGSAVGKGISVHNVNSHDLGVLGVDPKTKAAKRQIIIPRNRQLPCKESKMFITARDGQKRIVVKIVEGGTSDGQGSTLIGKCAVENLPGDIKKGTKVQVTFSYLNSGTIEVVAEVPSLKLKAQSAIERTAGMTDNERVTWTDKISEGLLLVDQSESADDSSGAEELPVELVPEGAPVFEVAESPTIAGVQNILTTGKAAATPAQPAVQPKKPVAKKAPAVPPTPVVAAQKPVPAKKAIPKKAPVKKVPAKKPQPAAPAEINNEPVIAALDIPDAKPSKSAVSALNLDLGDEVKSTAADSQALGNFLADVDVGPAAGESVLNLVTDEQNKSTDDSDSKLGDFLKGIE